MDCLFLVNPVSGSAEGATLLEELQQWSSPGMRISAIFTDPDRLEAQVHSMAEGKDLLVVAGGDGTIHSVLSLLAAMDAPPPAAIIPLGTGNDLARSTGWLDVWGAGGLEIFFAALVKARAEALDVWGCTCRGPQGELLRELGFCAYLGLGLDGRICQSVAEARGRRNSGRWRTRLGFLLFGLRNLVCSSKISGSLQMTGDLPEGTDDHGPDTQGSRRCPERLSFHSAELLFSNISSYAGGSLLPGRGNFSDGILELYNYTSGLGFACCMLLGMVTRSRSVFTPGCSTTGAAIFLDSGAHVQCDGEYACRLPSGSRMEIGLRRKIPLLIPPEDLFARRRLVKPVHLRFYGYDALAVKTSHYGAEGRHAPHGSGS